MPLRMASPIFRFPIATALRQSLAEGYGAPELRADLLAGLVVGIVALPLSMALGIASGVPPQHGLYTAIVAGGIIAVLGGSRAQVSGPTAAFIAILAPITAQYGVGGLMVATMLAGGLLVIMALGGLGRLITYIPYPVTMGFTTGIGVVIATGQLKDLFGLSIAQWPAHLPEQVAAMAAAADTARLWDLLIGLFTLAILIAWPRVLARLPHAGQKALRFVPAPLIGLGLAALVAFVIHHFHADFDVVTIGSKYAKQNGIPQSPPTFALPWSFPDAQGNPLGFSFALFRDLASPAVAIALLGAIESLLSAVIADGLAGTRHDPDAELFAQGVGNLVAPFFGGIAATGAIARTGTNIRAGAKSPISTVVHSLFVLVSMLALAPVLNYLPMASMAALLLMVAWNMSEASHFLHTLKHSPRSDVSVLAVCFLSTVVFDMVVAVVAGVLLASLLFMRRMAEVSEFRLIGDHDPNRMRGLPKGVVHYDIGGPLFFGAAQKAMQELEVIGRHYWAVVLDLEDVPAMDATGVVNLESAIKRLAKNNTLVVLSGVRAQPLQAITKAELLVHWGHVAVCETMKETIELLNDCAPEPADLSAQRTGAELLSRLTPARGNDVVTPPGKDSKPNPKV
jgi:SulP family sulfate permease